jgi:hypothetical protein
VTPHITEEVALLRLADGVAGYTLREACEAWPSADPNVLRTVLDDLVSRGKLRRSDGRYWRVRET